MNSISSYIGSDDEGDVIRSALASAMAMHEVLSGGGTASISSSSLVPPSLESSTEVLPGVAQSAVHTSQSPQVHSLPPTNDQSGMLHFIEVEISHNFMKAQRLD